MENLKSYTFENLESEEIINPMLVLADFFNDDWLPGHLDRLKVWRDYVINDDYFRGIKNSPAELLSFHKLNIRLIEALYLLSDKYSLSYTATCTATLELQKSTWRDFPSNLADSELLNPNIVMQLFFRSHSLPEYKDILYEWLEYGLSSSSANEFIETKDLVVVYENLQKLYSAAWLIHQRTTKNPYLKIDNAISKDDAITIPGNANLYDLNVIIHADKQELVSKLVALIKHKVETVQVIFYLGVPPNDPGPLFLLVLTANNEQRQAQTLSSTIEESCKPMAHVVALIHHASVLFTSLRNHNLFFNKALTCPVIYLSGDLLLPAPKSFGHGDNYEAPCLWKRWHSQGRDFLSGAEYYLKIGAPGAALFSLHQCVECLLIAIIRAVLGYRINNHNLSTLINISRMFTNDLASLFNLDDPGSLELFNLLKHAYVNVRYKDIFEPDTKSLATLYRVTVDFVTMTEAVYERNLLISSL